MASREDAIIAQLENLNTILVKISKDVQTIREK